MVWQFIHYPAGVAPSRDCAVRAPSLDTARRKLARALNVPAGTGKIPCRRASAHVIRPFPLLS